MQIEDRVEIQASGSVDRVVYSLRPRGRQYRVYISATVQPGRSVTVAWRMADPPSDTRFQLVGYYAGDSLRNRGGTTRSRDYTLASTTITRSLSHSDVGLISSAGFTIGTRISIPITFRPSSTTTLIFNSGPQSSTNCTTTDNTGTPLPPAATSAAPVGPCEDPYYRITWSQQDLLDTRPSGGQGASYDHTEIRYAVDFVPYTRTTTFSATGHTVQGVGQAGYTIVWSVYAVWSVDVGIGETDELRLRLVENGTGLMQACPTLIPTPTPTEIATPTPTEIATPTPTLGEVPDFPDLTALLLVCRVSGSNNETEAHATWAAPDGPLPAGVTRTGYSVTWSDLNDPANPAETIVVMSTSATQISGYDLGDTASVLVRVQYSWTGSSDPVFTTGQTDNCLIPLVTPSPSPSPSPSGIFPPRDVVFTHCTAGRVTVTWNRPAEQENVILGRYWWRFWDPNDMGPQGFEETGNSFDSGTTNIDVLDSFSATMVAPLVEGRPIAFSVYVRGVVQDANNFAIIGFGSG